MSEQKEGDTLKNKALKTLKVIQPTSAEDVAAKINENKRAVSLALIREEKKGTLKKSRSVRGYYYYTDDAENPS